MTTLAPDPTLADLVRKAEEIGPQPVVIDGQERAFLLSAEQWRLVQQRKPTFKEFLLSMPSFEGLDLERSRSRS